MTLPRPDMNPGSPRCFCTVCGHVFLTHVSFDKHRGIRASNDEDHQDRGRCWTHTEMVRYGLSQGTGVGGVWGTSDEWTQFRKYEAMRQARADR